MPLYEYQCTDCGGRDQRLAGLDDGTAVCQALIQRPGYPPALEPCGGLMLRIDEDIFLPYFEERRREQEALSRFKNGLILARQTLEQEVTP